MKTMLTILFGLMLFLPSVGLSQMEKRKFEFFGQSEFLRAYPAVGTEAPDMKIKTLKGEPVSLSSYRGKNVVLIKGSYT